MDSWFFNKIAGAVLSALLLAFGAGTMAELMHGHGDPSKKAKPGYELPVTGGAGAIAKAAPAPAFNFAEFAPLLKGGSADGGRALFSQCRSCHTVEKDGRAGQGPNLWGVVGQKLAANAGFPRYSNALKGKGGSWSYEALATYLYNPAAAIPGNQMSFQGIRNAGDLADIIAYLRTLSDSPVPLPN